MKQNQHYLQSDPSLHSDRYIQFVEGQVINKKFQFSLYFFIFNILWLLQKKLFALIPLWFLTFLTSLNVYYYFLDHRNPLDHQLLLVIIIVPHVLFSCFIYKIQNLYLENLIWKHRNNIPYLQKRIKPYNLLGFTVFVILCLIISINYFILQVTKNLGIENNPQALIRIIDQNSPENRAKFNEALKIMKEIEQAKTQNSEIKK